MQKVLQEIIYFNNLMKMLGMRISMHNNLVTYYIKFLRLAKHLHHLIWFIMCNLVTHMYSDSGGTYTVYWKKLNQNMSWSTISQETSVSSISLQIPSQNIAQGTAFHHYLCVVCMHYAIYNFYRLFWMNRCSWGAVSVGIGFQREMKTYLLPEYTHPKTQTILMNFFPLTQIHS